MSDVVIVASSPSARSRVEAVTDAVRNALVEAGLPVRVLQLRDLPESALLVGDREHPRLKWSRLLLSGASAVVVVTPCYERAGTTLVHSWLELVSPSLPGVLQVVGVGAFRAHASGLDTAFTTAAGDVFRLPACFLLDKWLLPGAGQWWLDAPAVDRISACASALAAELAPGFAGRLVS